MPAGADGAAFVQRCFSELENAVNDARSYRGKVLSLDGTRIIGDVARRHGPQMPSVRREDVILPEPTRKLLDRNVLSFMEGARICAAWAIDPQGHPALRPARYRQDPHHPLSRQQPARPHHADHHGAQVALLRPYMSLARLLQPAMVVIEDVDLIRAIATRWEPCDESLLN